MEQFFTDVYEKKQWGDNNNSEYNGSSGGGSDINYNSSYISFLKQFIIEQGIKTVVDLGSGDFRCGELIYNDIDISYTGYDTYKKVIDYNSSRYLMPKYSFIHLDFYNNKESIANGDLCILKDVLQHWKMCEIYNFLDYLIESKKFKYILIINCCGQLTDNPDNEGRSIPLSINFLPLKKYNPIKLLNYHTKEVSVIIN
jgi:hypothetical protein